MSINQSIKNWSSRHETDELKCILEIGNQKEQGEKIKPLKDLDPAIRATLNTQKVIAIEAM